LKVGFRATAGYSNNSDVILLFSCDFDGFIFQMVALALNPLDVAGLGSAPYGNPRLLFDWISGKAISGLQRTTSLSTGDLLSFKNIARTCGYRHQLAFPNNLILTSYEEPNIKNIL
jgi:hypothetical protein